MTKDRVEEIIRDFETHHPSIHIRYRYDKDADTYTFQMGKPRRHDEPIQYAITEYVSNLLLECGYAYPNNMLYEILTRMYIKFDVYEPIVKAVRL